MNSNKKIAILALIGVALATALALLFTTKKGKRIRNRAGEKGRELLVNLKNMDSCRRS